MRPPPNAVLRTAPTTRGVLRVLRGSVVGLAAAGLGATGHALAGGMLPDGRILATATAVLVVLTVAMSGRRWELPSLLTVLLGSQLALHVALVDPSHQHLMSSHHGASAGAMTTAHVLAALITALLLRRADEWCELLVDLLVDVLGRPLRTPRPVLLPAVALSAAAHRSPEERPDQWLVHWLSRRGPPAPALV